MNFHPPDVGNTVRGHVIGAAISPEGPFLLFVELLMRDFRLEGAQLLLPFWLPCLLSVSLQDMMMMIGRITLFINILEIK